MTALSCNGLRFVRRLSAYLQLSHALCNAHCSHCDVCIVSLLGIVHLRIVRLGIHCDLTEDYLLSRLFPCLTLLLLLHQFKLHKCICISISMCICIAKKYAKRSVQRLSRFVRVHRRRQDPRGNLQM